VSPVAIVTGAARGIGAATVDQLVAEGWHVVALDICADNPDLSYHLATPEDLAALASRHGERVLALQADVREQDDMGRAVRLAVEHFGQLDAAVAVAGVLRGGSPLWETPDAEWEAQFAVNVTGVRRLATAAIPVLLEAPTPRNGRFIAVASAAGVLGLRLLSGYTSSKHAVIGLVKALAADLSGTGVTANVVCPGSTRTAILDASADVYGLTNAEEFAHQQLVERLLEPQEPAGMIAWLCRREASGVTGAVLPVDGGLTTS
jgi:SDR family mycofactocin-dependent oxidoreductase